MHQCLFYLQDEKSAIPMNCEIVPRTGDRVLLDNRISGKVTDVCFETSIERSIKVHEKFFQDRDWSYHIYLSTIPNPQ